jgi:hypothetical protein
MQGKMQFLEVKELTALRIGHPDEKVPSYQEINV